MGNKKVPTPDLSWLDLNKYRPAEPLDLRGWFCQLSARAEIASWFDGSRSLRFHSKCHEKSRPAVSMFLQKIRENPILAHFPDVRDLRG